MNNITTDWDEVLQFCKNINVNKSSAIDYISSRILKDAFIILVDRLVTCFNLSLDKGIFTDDWKIAKVTPLHKGGQNNQINYFRPISQLPLPGKLLEQIAHKHLTSYLNTNNILNENQNGFRAKHSTQNT